MQYACIFSILMFLFFFGIVTFVATKVFNLRFKFQQRKQQKSVHFGSHSEVQAPRDTGAKLSHQETAEEAGGAEGKPCTHSCKNRKHAYIQHHSGNLPIQTLPLADGSL